MLLLLLACKHEDPVPAVVPYAPLQLHRLTDSQYRASVEALFGISYTGVLPEDYYLYGYTNVGAGEQSIAPLDLEQYEAAAWTIAQAVVPDAASRDALLGCPTEAVLGMPDLAISLAEACIQGYSWTLAEQAWRRPPERDELENLGLVFRETVEATESATVGLQAVIATVLLSPDFLFRVEVGQGGRTRTLNDYELAARLSLFLTDKGPDTTLLLAARAGKLQSLEGRAEQVDRLLKTEASKKALTRFFRESTSLYKLGLTDKDPTLFPAWNDSLKASMAQEVEKLFEETALKEHGDMRELLTSNRAYVDSGLAALYGLEGTGWQSLPPERGGLLGRAAFLALASHSTLTSPTLRGKYVRTMLLCQDIPPPPPGVADLEETVVDGTLRDRLEQHATDPSCSSCHNRMDPIGYAFEHFDPLGQYRTEDNGYPVDASAELDGTVVYGAAEMGATVALHPEFGPCMAQQLYRHAIGQLESNPELTLVEKLGADFVASDFDFLSLARSIALSDAFLYGQAPVSTSCETEGETRACATSCGAGEEICTDGRWLGCSAPAAALEQCDNADNDCDGFTDEYVVRGCAVGRLPGLQSCEAGVWGRCESPPAPSEVCNQQDDDQDGSVDEGLTVSLYPVSEATLTSTHGDCDPQSNPDSPACRAAMNRLCAASGCFITGIGVVARSTTTDISQNHALGCLDSSEAQLISTTFSTLSGYHGGCTSSSRQSPDCNAAIHRYCGALGLGSGYGPVENSGDDALIVCTPKGAGITTTYSYLATLNPGCDGVASRANQACNEAVHQLCQEYGFYTGHGPAENSGDSFYAVCLGSLE